MRKTAIFLAVIISILLIPAFNAMAEEPTFKIANSGRNMTITFSGSSFSEKYVVLRIGGLEKTADDIKTESEAILDNEVIEDFSSVIYMDAATADSSGTVVFKVQMPEDASNGQYLVSVFASDSEYHKIYDYVKGNIAYIPSYERVIHYDFENYEDFSNYKTFIDENSKYFSNVPSILGSKNSAICSERAKKYGRDNYGVYFYSDTGVGKSLYYNVLPYNNTQEATYGEAGLKIRSGNLAFSFKAAMSNHVKLKIIIRGLPDNVDLSEGVPASPYLSTNLLQINETTNFAISYDAVRNKASFPSITRYENVIERDKLHQYTVIYNYAKGTYNLYIDNHLLMEDRIFAGPLYPASFQVMAHLDGKYAAEEGEVASIYLDDLDLYTLSDEDLDAQYNILKSEGGRMYIEPSVLKQGEKAYLKAFPDNGYELKSITVAGKKYPGPAGNESFELPPVPYKHAEISGEFVSVKTLKKNFWVDFKEFEDNADFHKGNKLEKDLLKHEEENLALAGIVTYGEAYTKTEHGKLKLCIPGGSSAKLRLLGETGEFTKDFTSAPYAITFTSEIPQGVKLKLSAQNESGRNINICEYIFSDADKNITDGVRKYKFIINPEEDGSLYSDGCILSNNIALNSGINTKNFLLSFEANDYSEISIEDIGFYSLSNGNLKSQPETLQIGKGRILFDKEIYSPGDKAEISVIPPDNGYIKNVYINGMPIPAFGNEEISFAVEEMSYNTGIEVEFEDISPEPILEVSPLTLRDSTGTYVFLKIVSGKENIVNVGMQVSPETSDFSGEKVKTVLFDESLTSNGKGISAKGYYGYRIIRADKTAPFYIRPYATVGDIIYTGATVYVEPENIPVLN